MASRYLIDIILQVAKKGTGGKDLEKELKSAETSSESFGDSLGKLAMVGATVTGALITLKKAFDFGKEGAIVTQTRDSFEGLIEKLDAAPDTLDRLRTAARGTVDDMTLMSSTSTLLAGTQGELASQLAAATPELMNIAKAANKLNPTLGDTTFLYNSLAVGVKRASPLILDNLGLTIRIGEANERWAAKMGKTVEQMTTEEQKLALLEETLRAGQVMMEQAGGTTEAMGDSFAQAEAQIKNATDAIKSSFAPAMADVVSIIADFLTKETAMNAAFEAATGQAREAAGTYEEYVDRMANAAVASGALDEANAELIKRHLENGESIEALKDELDIATGASERYIKAVGIMTREEFEFQEALDNVSNVTEHWVEREREAAAATERASRVMDDAGRSSLALAGAIERGVTAFDEEGNALEWVNEQKKIAAEASARLQAAEDALADAVDRVADRYEGFYGALAEGIVSFRDLQAEQQQTAADYEQALADLEAKQRNATAGMEMSFQAALPDATEVAERLGMAGDAWDEWGLRLQDIINQGVASPWYAMLQEMGMEKPPDTGVKEWAADLKKAFYAGEVPDLLPPEWAQNVRAQQQEATAAFQQEAANRRAAVQQEIDALNAAREAQLEAERAQRNEATVEMALQLAEQQGVLRQWAEEEYGTPFAGIADTAAEVLGGLEAGTLKMTSGLESLIQDYVSGIKEVVDATGAAAEENQAKIQELGEYDFGAEMAEKAEAAKEAFAGFADPDALPLEDIKAQLGEVGSAMQQAFVPEEMPEDPLGLTAMFGGMENVTSAAGEMQDAVVSAFQGAEEQALQSALAAEDAWVGHSTIPDIIAGSQQMMTSASAAFLSMQTIGVAAGQNVGQSWATGLQAAQTELKEMVKRLKSLPTEIEIHLYTTVTGGEGAQHGAQWLVKGPGGIDNVPVSFMATAGEVVTVTPRGQNPPARGFQHGGQFTVPGLARTVTVEGDTHNWYIQDQGSVALAMRLVETRRRERLNEFMGA